MRRLKMFEFRMTSEWIKACYSGDVEYLKHLAEVCPYLLGSEDGMGNFGIHIGAITKNVEVVSFFARYSGLVNAITSLGEETSLHIAC